MTTELNFKPEQKAEITLYAWLLEHGIKTYLNRNDTAIQEVIKNYEVFKTDNTQRPDILIYTHTIGWCAIEVKSSNISKNIRQGIKILNYYDDYIKEKTKYFIDNEEIKINYFLLATEQSLKGRLFLKETKKDNQTTPGKICAVKSHIIPPYEYERTHELIRNLWTNWNERDKKVGLGILLSSEIDTIPNDYPMVFLQDYKNKWSQRWLQI